MIIVAAGGRGTCPAGTPPSMLCYSNIIYMCIYIYIYMYYAYIYIYICHMCVYVYIRISNTILYYLYLALLVRHLPCSCVKHAFVLVFVCCRFLLYVMI